jgi:hypothetical protein
MWTPQYEPYGSYLAMTLKGFSTVPKGLHSSFGKAEQKVQFANASSLTKLERSKKQ